MIFKKVSKKKLKCTTDSFVVSIKEKEGTRSLYNLYLDESLKNELLLENNIILACLLKLVQRDSRSTFLLLLGNRTPDIVSLERNVLDPDSPTTNFVLEKIKAFCLKKCFLQKEARRGKE